jgi:eukaryotic-like serine/threonine-protein kinase
MKQVIRLPGGEWSYDDGDRLGPSGGFGDVFRGAGRGQLVAVKRLKVTAVTAAHRELSIGRELQLRDLKNVVPIFDCGQDAQSDGYYLVMPICERSLQDELREAPDGVGLDTAIPIIRAVIAGLREVGDITHRDLKPGNILLHDGSWKIGDFGIAKFVEDATSLETLRRALTPLYAAPEQWNGDRPTGATDVYALGCIVHVLLTGEPPFFGSVDEIRDGHLRRPPPSIDVLPAGLSAFVTQMLRKVPSARPSLSRCAAVLENVPLETKEATAGRIAFSAAAKHVATEEAAEEAKEQQQANDRREREALIGEAEKALGSIFESLCTAMTHGSPGVKRSGLSVEFGRAKLHLSPPPYTFRLELLRRAGAPLTPWDIVACAKIAIAGKTQGSSYFARSLRSASLIFAKRKPGDDGFRWYEVAFFGLGGQTVGTPTPFGLLEDNWRDILFALSSTLHNVQVAYGPVSIDGENEGRFVDRWLDWVAKAATGQLRSPSMLPVTDPSSL